VPLLTPIMNFRFLTTLADEGAVHLAQGILSDLGIQVQVRPHRSDAQFTLLSVQAFDLLVPDDRLDEARAALYTLVAPPGEPDAPNKTQGTAADDWAAQRRRRFFVAIGLLAVLAVAILLSALSAPSRGAATGAFPAARKPG
jgi:hypothetical protein